MNSSPTPTPRGRALRGLFADHLLTVRGITPHTTLSYRDTVVLFLRFVGRAEKRSVSRLDLGISRQAADLLYEVINRRYERKPVMFHTNRLL